MFYYERKLKVEGFDLIIGVDEAGRGPLAGPVVAAAVALQNNRFRNRIDDSKKLTASARDLAFREITEKSIFGIGVIDEKIIDRVNIFKATCLAMEEAVNALAKKLSSAEHRMIHVIVDGNLPLKIDFPHSCIVGGDRKSKSIAAASILAKVTRDRIMDNYHRLYPEYGFIRHKGYPTVEHRQALRRLGLSEIHRRSFCCVER
ncbi:MAG: ribonuclease HII [Candidatus Omnitrophica bacterium]|nr:ribonuclease HII [Candidatus Omnitrophota bacterium]